MHYSFYLPVLGASLIQRSSLAQAADCSGDSGANPWISWAQDIRQAVCGDGACQPQLEGEGTGTCNMTMPVGGGWAMQWLSTDSAGTYKNW